MTTIRTLAARCASLGLLLSLAAPLQAQFPGYDRDLLDKLFNGDFEHIADDNVGRMDLEAVIMAFRTDDGLDNACSFFGGADVQDTQPAKFLQFIQYLNTDRDTGTFPSAQFMTLSIFGLEAWALDPNMLAMGVEIENEGCDSTRVTTIRRNLIALIERNIAWHARDRSAVTGVNEQRAARITAQTYRSVVEKDVALPAVAATMQQLAALEARGAQLLECEYGPLNPDSTGFQTFTFWYGNAPLTMNDFHKVSRRHPLGNLGDDAVAACPETLADAGRAASLSRQHGLAKLDQSALAPDALQLERFMNDAFAIYQRTRSSWLAFQASRDPQAENRAVNGKHELLKIYRDACDYVRKRPVPLPGNPACEIEEQLKFEFQAIPDPPASGPVLLTSTLPVGIQLDVVLLEPIDMLSQDEERRYRAELGKPALWVGGLTVVPKGAAVLLKLVREAEAMPNQVNVKITAESLVFNGQPTAIQTSFKRIATAADPRRGQPLPIGTALTFTFQAMK